jgi:hypothetical protein
MSFKISKREFLEKDNYSLSSITYNFNYGGNSGSDYTYPNASLKISDGSDTVYFDLFFENKKDLKESLDKFVKMRDALDEFIKVVTEHQTDALKAAIR